jgi:hypothetical protein
MVKEEARAVEHNKREGARADQVVHAAEVLSRTTTKPYYCPLNPIVRD